MALLHAVFLVGSFGLRPLVQAVAMATLVPAQATGIGELTGSIEEGKRTDLLLVDHRHGHPDLLRTWVRGRDVYATC